MTPFWISGTFALCSAIAPNAALLIPKQAMGEGSCRIRVLVLAVCDTSAIPSFYTMTAVEASVGVEAAPLTEAAQSRVAARR